MITLIDIQERQRFWNSWARRHWRGGGVQPDRHSINAWLYFHNSLPQVLAASYVTHLISASAFLLHIFLNFGKCCSYFGVIANICNFLMRIRIKLFPNLKLQLMATVSQTFVSAAQSLAADRSSFAWVLVLLHTFIPDQNLFKNLGIYIYFLFALPHSHHISQRTHNVIEGDLFAEKMRSNRVDCSSMGAYLFDERADKLLFWDVGMWELRHILSHIFVDPHPYQSVLIEKYHIFSGNETSK